MLNKNPLVNEHPVDTLSQIQSILLLLQEFAAHTAESGDTPAQSVRVHHGMSSLLTSINGALEYEIKRLENYRPLVVVK